MEGSKFIDQLAAICSVVGGKDAGSMGRKGVVKERLLQTFSVTTQVAISRRVSRLGTARKRKGAGGAGMTDPHRWRGWSLEAA